MCVAGSSHVAAVVAQEELQAELNRTKAQVVSLQLQGSLQQALKRQLQADVTTLTLRAESAEASIRELEDAFEARGTELRKAHEVLDEMMKKQPSKAMITAAEAKMLIGWKTRAQEHA